MELVKSEIEKIGAYQKTLLINNNLFVVNQAGIFEFTILDNNVILTGYINQFYLNNKKINPFMLKDKNVYHYFILNNKNIFKASDVRLVPRNNIYFLMKKHLNKKTY